MKRLSFFTNHARRCITAFLVHEDGQDLIEYALVVALIALAAAAGMSGVANSINNAFTTVGTKLASYTS